MNTIKAAPFQETPNAIRRRKVLMLLLSDLMNNKCVMQALLLWEHTFGSDEILIRGTVEYSRLLHQKFNLTGDPLLFSNQLIRALMHKDWPWDDMHDPVGMLRILSKRQQTNSTNDNLAPCATGPVQGRDG